MKKHRTKKSHNSKKSRHHRLVGGVLAAALAFTVAVGSQLGGFDGGQLGTEVQCWDGAHADGYVCTAPPAGSPPPSGGGMINCPNGTQVPQGSTCPTSGGGTMINCPNGTQVPQGSTCPTSGGGTMINCPNGTQVPQGSTCPTSGTTGTTTGTQTGTADTVGACQGRGGQWTAASSTCSVAPGTMASPADQLKTEPTCTSGGYFWSTSRMWCFSTQAAKTQGEGGSSTGAVNTGTMTTAQMQAGCVAAKGTWDTVANYCKMPAMTGTTGQFPQNTTGQFPQNTTGQFPQNTTGQFPQNTTGQFPQNTTGQFPMGSGMTGGYTGSTFGPMPMPFFNFGNQNMGSGQMGQMGSEGMNTYGNQPMFGPSFQGGCPPGDPFCTALGDEGFDKYQTEMPMFGEGMEFQKPGANLNDVKRRAKEIERDYNMRVKELDRASRESGGLACPALVEGQTYLTKYKEIVDAAKNVTDANVAEVAYQIDYVFGGPDINPEDTLSMKLGQIMPKLGFCQGSAHFLKEVSRMKADATRMKVSSEQEGELAEILAELTKIEANPFEGIDLEFSDPRDLFDKLEDIRWRLDDLRRNAGQFHAQEGVCDELGRMKGEIGAFAAGESDMFDGNAAQAAKAKEAAPKALGIIEKGLAACASGDSATAQKAMNALDKLGQEIFGNTGGPNMENPFEADVASMTGNLLEGILGSDLDPALQAIIGDIMSKLKADIEKIVTQAFAEVTATLAQLQNSAVFSEESMNVVMGTMDGASSMSTGEEIVEIKNELSEVINEVAVNVEAIDGLGNAVLNDIEEVNSIILEENWTADAAAEIKEETDSFATFLSTTPEADEVEEFVAEFKEFVEEKKEEDKAGQVEDCHVPFADVSSTDWHMSYFGGTSKCGSGELPVIFEGTGTSGGTEVNPSGQLNLAEFGTMISRAYGIEADSSATVRAGGVPEWFDGIAGGLANLGVSELNDPNVNVAQPMDRTDTAEFLVEVLDKQGVIDADSYTCNLEFSDIDCSQPGSLAVSILVEEGVITGNPDGSYAPDRVLNRAESAALIYRAMDATAVEEEFDYELVEDFGTTTGGFESMGGPQPTVEGVMPEGMGGPQPTEPVPGQ